MLADLAPTSSGYRILLLLHIACVIVGFGSTFVYPIMGAQAGKLRGTDARALSDTSLIAAKRITTPVIYAAGALGLVLVLASDQWDFDQTWVQAALTVFIAAMLFSGFVHVPNLKRMNRLAHELVELSAAGPPAGAPPGPPPQAVEMEARSKRAAINGGILHLALLTLLILMIWKPT